MSKKSADKYKKNIKSINKKVEKSTASFDEKVFKVLLKSEHDSAESVERKLEESNKKLQWIIDAMPAIIGYINTEYKFQFANKYLKNFLNVNPSDIIGQHIKDVAGEKAFDKVKSKYDAAFAGKRQDFETLIPLPNGGVKPIHATYIPHKVKGKIEGAFILIQDISARKQDEKELKDAKKALEKVNRELAQALKIGVNQFNLFANNLPGNVFIKDDKLEYIFLNDTSLKTFKIDNKNIQGLTVHDLYPENIANTLHEVDLEVQGKMQIIEKEVKSIDGRLNEKWERVIKFPIKMPDDKVFIGGIALDISEQKQRNQAIINSELQYRSLFESARDAILIIDFDKIIDVNQSTLKKFGYQDKSEIINKSVIDISPKFQPDGNPSRESAIKVIKKALTGEPQLFNWKHKRKDGTEFHTEVALNQFSFNDNNYILASVRDISKRRAIEQELITAKENAEISEKYLDSIINNIGDPIFVKDEESRLFHVNDAFCALFDLTRSNIIGKTLAEDVSPEEMENFLKIDKQVLESGQESIIEESLTVRGAETKIISTRKTRYIDNNGKKFLIGVIRDITDRKLAEENVKETLMQLNLAVNTAKIGVWSHNIATDKLEWNSELFKIFGMTPSEFDNSSGAFIKMVHPEDLDLVMENYNKAFENKSVAGFNYRIVRPNKEVRYIYASVTPIFDDKKNLIKITGINLDVTKTKISEIALNESKTKFEILSNVSFEGILIHDNGVPVDLNHSFPEIFGYTKDEFLNEDLVELIIKKDYQNIVYENIKNEYQLPYEVIGIKKDGTEFPIEIEGKTYISEENKKLRVTAIRDITERKKAQLQLENTLKELTELKQQIEAENIYLKEELKLEGSFHEIIGSSKSLTKTLKQVEQVAPSDATVLILGETGTGKELIAKALHSTSGRNQFPLIKVNCSALPTELIESEFFGHEKGAFTGALNRKIGRFELAHKGTIFLDEIGDLPIDLQTRLLRVLQESEFERVGGEKTIKVDVRVVAATNRNLEELIMEGKFRQDLYYRLNVFPITCPPLRERKEDVPSLVYHFINKYNNKIKNTIKSVPAKTINRLMNYNWPGNIRELEHVIERAMVLNFGEQLQLGKWFVGGTVELDVKEELISLEQAEREYITKVLEKSNGKIRGKDGAAEILGLKPTTLESKIKKLNISKKG
jgi:PAS domain S-box-containing protein